MASKLVQAIVGGLKRFFGGAANREMDQIMQAEVRRMKERAAKAAVRRVGQMLERQPQAVSDDQLNDLMRRELEAMRRGQNRGPATAPDAPPDARPATRPRTPRPRKTTDIDEEDITPGGRGTHRVRNDDPMITGEMIPVRSSNVHSIGFRLDPESGFPVGTKGTLLIRFLGGHGKERSGPGALYEYFDVPASLFRAFRRAASKGKFVWDEVRVRGTISGHRYSYALADISGGYVPRQAGLKRGAPGEWYLTRRFRDSSGALLTSRLPEMQVRSAGPNRANGPGAGKLILKRGTPKRGGPSRGGPNRGAP